MPGIRAELQDAGIVASRKHIADLMRQAAMRRVQRQSEQVKQYFEHEPVFAMQLDSSTLVMIQ